MWEFSACKKLMKWYSEIIILLLYASDISRASELCNYFEKKWLQVWAYILVSKIKNTEFESGNTVYNKFETS